MIVTIASAKGGVAKTTTAMMLAAACVTRGLEARVVDADPQASASLWAGMVAGQGLDLGFDVVPGNQVTLASQASGPAGWSFVDCPPSGRTLEVALGVADFVVVPSSESATDLQQAWATLASCEKPSALLFTRVETRTSAFRRALEAVDSLGTPRFDAVVGKGQDLKTVFGNPVHRLHGYGEVLSELLTALEG